MKKSKQMINWGALWGKFYVWLEKDIEKICSKCGHLEDNEPDWDEQQAKIEELVEQAIQKKAKCAKH